MIEIKDTDLFGKIVAEELTAVYGNAGLNDWEKVRFVNALAKATAQVEKSSIFMDYDREADKLLIWSDSNQIYEVNADKTCQCRAALNGNVCWHRAAKRLISRYLLAESTEEQIEYLQSEGWSRAGAIATLG